MATTPCPLAVVVLFTVVAGACGGSRDAGSSASSGAPQAGPEQAQLTPDEVRDGIGPAPAVTLGAVDAKLAKEGEEIFTTKCSACHRLNQRYVGPALGEVTKRRTPRYVLNMILNPTEMTQKHPVARQLLATHMTQMPALGLTQAEARAVLEYLRKAEQPEQSGKS